MKTKSRPYIKAAAYRDEDSKTVYVGRTHIEAADNLPEIGAHGPRCIYFPGFVLNNGRFVNRNKAARIAFQAGQIKKKKVVLSDRDLQ